MQRYSVYNGLLHGGGFHLLGVQLLAAGCCLLYAVVTTAAILLLLGSCIRFSAANLLFGKVVQSRRRPPLGPSPG